MDANTNEDLQLVQEVLAGNRNSFSVLVKKYQRSLLRLSLRFVKDLATAEDAVQETFIKAFEKLDTFAGRASFRSWLFQIAVNTSRNKLRERKDGMVDIENVNLSTGPTAEIHLSNKALSKMIQDFVETLPEKQRVSMELRIYEDLSFKEIAELMDCPYDTAKANYRHALMKLKDHLQNGSHAQDLAFEEVQWIEQHRKILEAEI